MRVEGYQKVPKSSKWYDWVVVGVVRVGRRVSAGETSGAQLLPTDTHLAGIILTLSHVRQ